MLLTYLLQFIDKCHYVIVLMKSNELFKLFFKGGEVDLATLVQLVSQKVTNPPLERPDDLRDMFRLYDKDGRGFISVQEMRHLLTSVGEKLTEEEADELLRMTGCVQNGQVQYDSEFCTRVLSG